MQHPAEDSPNRHDDRSGARAPLLIELSRGDSLWRFTWNPGDESHVLAYALDVARTPGAGLDMFDIALIAQNIGRRLTEELYEFALPETDPSGLS